MQEDKEFIITENLFHTKMHLKQKVGNRYKTVMTAPVITKYAPELVLYNKNLPIIYVGIDRFNKSCSVYSEDKGLVLGCAKPVYASLTDYGTPMLFKVGTETVYISPEDASKHFIGHREAICFEQDELCRPTHRHVYKVKNGMPEEIFNVGDRSLNQNRITRYDPCGIIDYCEDIYSPFLISDPSQVVTYLGSHTAQNYRDMARDYARIEGAKNVPTYLSTMIDHLREVTSQADFERDTFNQLREVDALFVKVANEYQPVQNTTHSVDSQPQPTESNSQAAITIETSQEGQLPS